MTTSTVSRLWTEQDTSELFEAAQAAGRGELNTVFQRFAEEFGVPLGTVRGKYYDTRNARARDAGDGRPIARSRRNRKARRTWSRVQNRRLVQEVSGATGAERQLVYERWARTRGVTVTTIQHHYYQVRKRFPKLVEQAGASVNGSPVPTAPAAAAGPTPGMRGAATAPVPSVDVTSLTLAELTSLGRSVAEELDRRVSALGQVWR